MDFKSLINIESEDISEVDVIASIEERVSQMMDHDIELLMSYMYRLDIAETDIKQAMKLNAKQSMPNVFAQLIWKRQKQRMETRKKYKQDPIEDWEY